MRESGLGVANPATLQNAGRFVRAVVVPGGVKLPAGTNWAVVRVAWGSERLVRFSQVVAAVAEAASSAESSKARRAKRSSRAMTQAPSSTNRDCSGNSRQRPRKSTCERSLRRRCARRFARAVQQFIALSVAARGVPSARPASGERRTSCGRAQARCLRRATSVSARDWQEQAERTTDGAGHAKTVLSCERLQKIYRMGEVDVRALRGVDFDLRRRASWSCCSAPRAAASRRCSTSSAGSTCPRRARVLYRDHDLTAADERRADALPPRARRLRLPVLQPDPEPHGARERRAGHRDRRRSDATRRRRSRWSGSATGSITSRRSSRAASSSASRSRAPSPSGPTCCSATSRPARSTSETGMLVLDVHRAASTASSARRPRSSRTTRRSPRWPTAWSRSPTGGSPASEGSRRARRAEELRW